MLHHTRSGGLLGRDVRADLCRWPARPVSLAAAEPFGDTAVFLALGAACVINFGRNRTFHCGLTGPIFAVGPIAAAMIEAEAWQFDMRIVWGAVLLGVAVALAIEWRMVPARAHGAGRLESEVHFRVDTRER